MQLKKKKLILYWDQIITKRKGKKKSRALKWMDVPPQQCFPFFSQKKKNPNFSIHHTQTLTLNL